MDRSKDTCSRTETPPWSMPDGQLAIPTILVVEDDPDIREMLAVLLDLAELSAVTCGTAEAALDLLREQQVDLVLTDYALPGESGLWLLDRAAEEGLIRDTPVLVVTAYPEPAGLAGYEVIQKPFDLDDLVGRVRMRLGQRRSSVSRSIPSPRSSASSHGVGSGECPDPVELIVYVPRGAQRQARARQIQEMLSRFISPHVKLTFCEIPPGSGDDDGSARTPGQVMVRRGSGPHTFILGHVSKPDLLLELLDGCGQDPV